MVLMTKNWMGFRAGLVRWKGGTFPAEVNFEVMDIFYVSNKENHVFSCSWFCMLCKNKIPIFMLFFFYI